MSSPKPARKAPRRTASARAASARKVQPVARPPAANDTSASAEARRLAVDMERALAGGRRDLIDAAALQALMAALCKTYSAQVEAGEDVLPLPPRGGATATDVMVTASGLLKSANLAVFELGMWQSWTGR
jgi:hypothetical protein